METALREGENGAQIADSIYDIIRKRHVTGMLLPPQMFSVPRNLYGRLPLNDLILSGEKTKERYPKMET